MTSRNNGAVVHGPAQPVEVEKTFAILAREQAANHGNRLLVTSEHQQRSLTYAQADERSDALALGLLALGVEKGDNVAILMGNEVEYIETFLACVKIGTPITLTNYAYTETELHSVLSSCGATALIMVSQFDNYDYRSWMPRLHKSIRGLKHVLVVHDDTPVKATAGFHPYEEVVASGSISAAQYLARLRELEKEHHHREIMNLQFTSGSTGLPKASALTHRGVYNAGIHMGAYMHLTSEDVICLPVPLFHAFGLVMGVCVAMIAGASVVLPDNKFNPEATLVSIQKHKCTGIYGVTTMFISEMSVPDFASYDFSSLRFALTAGSAFPEALLRKIKTSFDIQDMHSTWGLTEASSVMTMTKRSDPLHKNTESSGRIFPGAVGKIVNPATGKAARRGERGEIVLRSGRVQDSYYNNTIKTAEAHRVTDDDGLTWLFTGDEGFIDVDGYFVITGRIKEMIIRGGENIMPPEIEQRLVAHPSIAQAAVVGVPDERYGEEICAFVEASEGPEGRPEARPSVEQLKEWVREVMAPFKRAKYVIWLGSCPEFMVWPKTASGKLRKPDLRLIASKLLSTHGGGGEPVHGAPVQARL
ncbi:acetyl-CoA synthetase-like protein [Sarocladium strictum]